MEALAVFTRIDPDFVLVTAALNEWGQIARWRGNLDLAEQRFLEAAAHALGLCTLSRLCCGPSLLA
ncbi:MAG: hypothetical protein ACE5E7_16375 [Anaerolineae bacterium]